MEGKLKHGEAVDVYLAELRRLSTLIGGLPDKAITGAFVAGLPEEVRRVLRSSSRMDDLITIQILARARENHFAIQPSTTVYFYKIGNKAEEVLARLTAVDRIPFSTLANIEDVKNGWKAQGLKIPDDRHGIKVIV